MEGDGSENSVASSEVSSSKHRREELEEAEKAHQEAEQGALAILAKLDAKEDEFTQTRQEAAQYEVKEPETTSSQEEPPQQQQQQQQQKAKPGVLGWLVNFFTPPKPRRNDIGERQIVTQDFWCTIL